MGFNPNVIAARFFVKDKTLVVGIGALTQLVEANANRIGLIIATGAPTGFIGVSSKITGSFGISLTANSEKRFNFSEFPAMVTGPWFIFSAGGGNFYVIEEIKVSSEGE